MELQTEWAARVTTSTTNHQKYEPPPGTDLQKRIKATGQEIFSLMEQESTSIFNKDWWYGGIMEWSMKNEHFKTQMFRFVDVLPYLKSSSEITRHLKEYFSESGDNLPSVLSFGMGVGSLVPGVLSMTVRKNVTQMARMFIAGEDPREALSTLEKNRDKNISFTVDLLGEATLSEKEALEYQRRYIDLIRWLARQSKSWDEKPQIDRDHRGSLPKVNVSVKMSALFSQINLKDWDGTKESIKSRLRPVFDIAMEDGVFINLDMEQYSLKDLTLEVWQELLLEPRFKNYPHWGIVIQGYLIDSLQDIERLIAFSKQRQVPFTVRLVKGAYWDYETVEARQKLWPVPVFEDKNATDANFEACAKLLLENVELIRPAIASHNVRSIAATIEHAKSLGLDKSDFEIQMLYGMAEPIKKALVKMGIRVRQYTPIGELIPGMAYLVRRLLENTSNESFLRSKFAENVSTEKLLEDPKMNIKSTSNNQVTASPSQPLPPFQNEALLDFTKEENRKQMQAALNKLKSQLGKTYSVMIDNKSVSTNRKIKSLNPSNPSEVIGEISIAGIEEADRAVESAAKAYPQWRATSVNERAVLLDKVADLMKAKRFELTALQVLEVGKNWSEADGDVCEAIDFCRYYAREMRRLQKPIRVGSAPGEVSLYHYQPRGVSLVIAPWNFPLAILTGMVAASLVTGNTVVMKPAEQSSVVAAGLMDLLKEAGVPAGVVHFLPGLGEEVGEHLVNHPKVSLIAFTGSKEVGLHIIKRASELKPGQHHVKRCIIEMGGKNAVIIDSDADLDEAVLGVMYSAFGFQGQKCSAASRAIVLEEIYDRFIERLTEATKSIRIESSENPASFVGPVIDEEAQKKILSTIEANKSKFKIAYQAEVPKTGYFVPPTIFANVDPNSSLAQEEIFGPVLAVIKAKDIDHALEIANSTAYGLTGGLYSRSPANIEMVKMNMDVGNFYINRPITGAIVERHPFGGFKLSGIGSKTGGPDYLLQFMEPRCITENTLRRGFAPADEQKAH